jgi:hypothetical protein
MDRRLSTETKEISEEVTFEQADLPAVSRQV